MSDSKCGVFVRKLKFIRAEQVTEDYEKFIDRNGETFIGFRDDFKCYDEAGNIYYINKHEFLANYSPWDGKSWGIVSDWKDRQIKEKIRIINNIEKK